MPNDELELALRGSSLHSLLILTSKALARAGYGDVELTGRRHPRQKSRDGGHEIVCSTKIGMHTVKVVVKVARESAKTRMLDETVGAAERVGAEIAMLVTPFKVSPKMAAKQAAYKNVALKTMDGESLASLMRCSGIAVRPSGDVDYAYLSQLEEVGDRILDFMRKEAA